MKFVLFSLHWGWDIYSYDWREVINFQGDASSLSFTENNESPPNCIKVKVVYPTFSTTRFVYDHPLRKLLGVEIGNFWKVYSVNWVSLDVWDYLNSRWVTKDWNSLYSENQYKCDTEFFDSSYGPFWSPTPPPILTPNTLIKLSITILNPDGKLVYGKKYAYFDNLRINIIVQIDDPYTYTNSVLLKKVTKQVASDSHFVITRHSSLDTDSLLFALMERRWFFDSVLHGTVEKSTSVDSYITIGVSDDTSTDSFIYKKGELNSSTNSVLAGSVTSFSNTDTFIIYRIDKSLSTNSLTVKEKRIRCSVSCCVSRLVLARFKTNSLVTVSVNASSTTNCYLQRFVTTKTVTSASLFGFRLKKTSVDSFLSTFPRMSLYELLPTIVKIRDLEASGTSGSEPILKKVINVLNEQSNDINSFITGLFDILNIHKTPYLPLINALLGGLDLEGLRDDLSKFLISEAVHLHKLKGTSFLAKKNLQYKSLDSYTIQEVYKSSTQNEYGNYSLTKDETHPYRAARVALFDRIDI